MELRPAPGDRITVLFQVDGIPFSDATTVGRVGKSGVIADRSVNNLDPTVTVGVEATVLFARDDRLTRWPMRIEAVLPSSYYLVSLAEPGAGQRREFVRAGVQFEVTLGPLDGESTVLTAPVDLSASGFRVEGAPALVQGSEIEVQIAWAGADEPIWALARVVRGPDNRGQGTLACEFVDLASADEARLVELVFSARASNLAKRIGD